MKEAFEYLRSTGKAHIQQDIANKMGISKTNVSRVFNGDGKYLTKNFLHRFNEAYGNVFNYDWLLTGDGEMLTSATQSNPPKTLRELLKEKNISQATVAAALSIQPANLRRYDNLRDRSFNEIITISKATGISIVELLGGNVIPLPREKDSIPRIELLESDISDNIHEGTLVYDIDATCGPNNRDIDFTQDIVIGSVNLPEIDKNSKIVFASGDSMFPLISNGDRIVIREIENWNFIYYGQIYLIITSEYRMVKYIRKHPTNNKEYILLRSKNPDFDDIELPRKEIIRLFVVENILSIKTVL